MAGEAAQPQRSGQPTAATPEFARLAAHQLQRSYLGGARIAALRGDPAVGAAGPEDWVGSTTTALGSDSDGLSALPDGRLLRDAIVADPEGFLGGDHVRRWGADPAVLVKLLDAGERLPVHFHPGRAFARAELGLSFGKTETWIILAAELGAAVHLGFTRAVPPPTVASWIEEQDIDAMLAAMHELRVAAGDVIFVPAGTAHAIGAGILLCELQEPTDLSVFLESGHTPDAQGTEHLGLGWPTVLAALDHDAVQVDPFIARATRPAAARESLLPEVAAPYFRAERISGRLGPAELDPGFSMLVALEGQGIASGEHGGRFELRGGDTVLVSHRAGRVLVEGDTTLIRCRPPAPETGAGPW